MTKNELRKKYKLLRSNLSQDEIVNKSISIANKTLLLDIWDKTFYHLFLTIDVQREVDTEFVLSILAGKDKEVVISKCNFETFEMTHFLLTENTKIKPNAYHIPEPVTDNEVLKEFPVENIEVVFVPLLAFDENGNRVGYGKGFYDTFLSRCSKNVIKIGLSFFEAEQTIDDLFENDIRLNFCVTPEKIYSFN